MAQELRQIREQLEAQAGGSTVVEPEKGFDPRELGWKCKVLMMLVCDGMPPRERELHEEYFECMIRAGDTIYELIQMGELGAAASAPSGRAPSQVDVDRTSTQSRELEAGRAMAMGKAVAAVGVGDTRRRRGRG